MLTPEQVAEIRKRTICTPVLYLLQDAQSLLADRAEIAQKLCQIREIARDPENYEGTVIGTLTALIERIK